MPETTTPANPSGVLPEEETRTRPRRNFFSFGLALLYLVVASIIAMAVLPPLLNVNRFKRRIVTSISQSLGRPVHLDSVTLVLLPFPGFKLTNFVVAEDPAFGSEPVIHANEVVAILRLPSLYSKKVEFSRISLKEPSINLVHNANGAWNVESILLKAEQISAAPTEQAKAGPEPRFPYIEATDARLNIKSGIEKLPFSLVEADFALWLPQPSQWRVRASGKPTRTDSSASDTGTVSVEGTLSRAASFDLIPIDLAAEWKNVPLGEASRVVTGQDAGLRGELRINMGLRGTVGTSVLKTSLDLRGLRRDGFVPDRPINVRADCQAVTAETFHALHEIRCIWPPPGDPTLLALTGDLPSIHDPASGSLQLGTPGLPAATLLQWLRAVSPRVSPDIIATGTLTGSLSRTVAAGQASTSSGQLALTAITLTGGPLGKAPIAIGNATISSGIRAESFSLSPVSISLGGKEPATLEGVFDTAGYSLHLTGNVLPSRLLELAAAVPQFGDGLSTLFLPPSGPQPSATKEVPIHIDLTSQRPWIGGQSWSRTVPAKVPHPRIRLRRSSRTER